MSVPMKTAYSDLKAAYHTGCIDSLRNTGRCLPPHVQLIISDLCNHDCSFCAYRMSGYTSNQNFGEAREDGTVNNNPNRRWPFKKALEILDDCDQLGVKAVQFTGGGEPTAHKNHIKIFSRALELGFKCALVTNGSKLADGWEKVYPKFSWMRVSLDAGTPETYAAIRRVRPSQFQKTLENISRLDDAGCLVGVSFIVTKDNWHEIYEAYEAVRVAGASSIRYGAIFTPKGSAYYDESGLKTKISSLIGMAVANAKGQEFQVIDQFSHRLDDLDDGQPDYPICGYQHFNMYIGGDLKVYRCCNTAYNDLGLIGDLNDGKTLLDWWDSDEAEAAYTRFSPRACERCAFNRQNRVINYLAGPEDPHVDFV